MFTADQTRCDKVSFLHNALSNQRFGVSQFTQAPRADRAERLQDQELLIYSHICKGYIKTRIWLLIVAMIVV